MKKTLFVNHVKLDKIKKKYKDNWLIMSFIEKEGKNVLIDGVNYKIVNKKRKELKPIYSVISVFSYTPRTK